MQLVAQGIHCMSMLPHYSSPSSDHIHRESNCVRHARRRVGELVALRAHAHPRDRVASAMAAAARAGGAPDLELRGAQFH